MVVRSVSFVVNEVLRRLLSFKSLMYASTEQDMINGSKKTSCISISAGAVRFPKLIS